MKLLWFILLGFIVLNLHLSARAESDDTLMRSVIAGGGVSGGTDSLSGTMGQWDAVPSSANAISLTSGFWNLYPFLRLRVQLTSGFVTIAWSASYTGLQLEQSSTVGTGAVWTGVTQPVSTANGENQVTVTVGSDSRFFRLRLQ